MAFLFGSGQKNISTTENKLSGVQIQNSSQGVPIPIVYGKTRVSINSIWYGDFVAIPHTETQSSGGGKGGGGGGSVSNTSYTYTTGWVGGVCEGPITGFGTVWESKNITTTANLGLTEFLGTYLQAPWSYLTTNHPTEAFGYRGQAYVATAAYNLGISSSLPNLSFEVKGILFDACVYDVTAAQVFYDVLSNGHYGAEFPAAQVGDLTDFYVYCKAAGLVVSPAYITQRAAADIVTELALVGNSAPVWSEGVLKMIPYAEAEISGDWIGCGPTPPDPPFASAISIIRANSSAIAVTDDGLTVVGATDSDVTDPNAFRWISPSLFTDASPPAGYTAISLPQDHSSSVSADCSVVGSYASDFGGITPRSTASRWNIGGAITLNPDYVDPLEDFGSGVSANGQVVAGYGNVTVPITGNVNKCFTWTTGAAHVVILADGTGPTDPTPCITYGLNSDGSIVIGAAKNPTVYELCRWVSGSFEILGAPSGSPTGTRGQGCSDDGSVIFGNSTFSSSPDGLGWMYTDGDGFTYLETPVGCTSHFPRDISADGRYIVGTAYYVDGYRGVVWDNGAVLTIIAPATGYSDTSINGISPNGAFAVGDTYNTGTGQNDAVLWNLSLL